MSEPEYLYRATTQRFAGCSISVGGCEDYYVTAPRVMIRAYLVLKRTPKGAWIKVGGWPFEDEKRFVLLTARKRFACPTKAEALESLVARKQAHLRHAQRRVADVKDHLRAAVAELGKVQRERSAG